MCELEASINNLMDCPPLLDKGQFLLLYPPARQIFDSSWDLACLCLEEMILIGLGLDSGSSGLFCVSGFLWIQPFPNATLPRRWRAAAFFPYFLSPYCNALMFIYTPPFRSPGLKGPYVLS